MAEIMIVDGRADEADSYLDEAYDFFYDDDYYDDMPLDVAVLFTDYDEVEYADKWLQRSDETDEIDYIVTKAKILAGQGKIHQGTVHAHTQRVLCLWKIIPKRRNYSVSMPS